MTEKKRHILLIDDESAFLELLERILLRAGYIVTSFNSSIEAINVFSNSPKEFDLIITDLKMPKLTGEVFIRKVKKLNSYIPIIVLTGHGMEFCEQQFRLVKPDLILMKPIEIKDLEISLNSLFNNHN